MKKLIIAALLLLAGSAAFAQRADVSAQERSQAEFARDHYNGTGGSRVDVGRDQNGRSVRETFTSANGDRNTIIRDHDTNRTTTIIDHPDGTREVNGRQVEHSDHSEHADHSDHADRSEHQEHEHHDAPDHDHH
ncbi:hypothetical protein [Mucilaginibacter ginsenosidivorax]|uniref:Uncharacterized protein n=1 Tax=Mucilaginibacter ginsenosidivorax TaxID=862126 RepID=A0A5B8VYC7_9SPHI|nr:hypothetical protein [Mucilaginibacter ginsenosidivorax]QEC75962.1 hypothetical protein FSB76_08385 [Mucilaginibacter ginsenosidivorax]